MYGLGASRVYYLWMYIAYMMHYNEFELLWFYYQILIEQYLELKIFVAKLLDKHNIFNDLGCDPTVIIESIPYPKDLYVCHREGKFYAMKFGQNIEER